MAAFLSIRRATAADAPAIAAVHTHSWQWAYRGLLPDDFLDGLSGGLAERVVAHERYLAKESSGERTWVAECEGRVAGFATAGPSRDRDASPETGELWGIYLEPEAAGKGIGRALLDHAVDHMRSHRYREATLWVLEGNVRARAFYEKAGWRADGVSRTEVRPRAHLHEVRYHVDLGR